MCVDRYLELLHFFSTISPSTFPFIHLRAFSVASSSDFYKGIIIYRPHCVICQPCDLKMFYFDKKFLSNQISAVATRLNVLLFQVWSRLRCKYLTFLDWIWLQLVDNIASSIRWSFVEILFFVDSFSVSRCLLDTKYKWELKRMIWKDSSARSNLSTRQIAATQLLLDQLVSETS